MATKKKAAKKLLLKKLQRKLLLKKLQRKLLLKKLQRKLLRKSKLCFLKQKNTEALVILPGLFF